MQDLLRVREERAREARCYRRGTADQARPSTFFLVILSNVSPLLSCCPALCEPDVKARPWSEPLSIPVCCWEAQPLIQYYFGLDAVVLPMRCGYSNNDGINACAARLFGREA